MVFLPENVEVVDFEILLLNSCIRNCKENQKVFLLFRAIFYWLF